jgi:hypothetical protein
MNFLPQEIQNLIYSFEYNNYQKHFDNNVIPDLNLCFKEEFHFINNKNKYKITKRIKSCYFFNLKKLKKICKNFNYKTKYNYVMKQLQNIIRYYSHYYNCWHKEYFYTLKK